MSADKVKFRKPVRPGDQLRIHAKLTKVRSSKIAVAEVSCSVDGQVVSSADLMITIVGRRGGEPERRLGPTSCRPAAGSKARSAANSSCRGERAVRVGPGGELAVEAGAVAVVAGARARVLDLEEEHILVAVDEQVDDT